MLKKQHDINPSNSQNFNRFSYVLNNPLKYSDPSGYNYIDWTYAYGTGNGGPRHWKQELDYIYNRGEYSLGGGFGGLGKFYYVNGKGYQITSSGSIISTNKNDQGTNAFYQGDDFGFYAQTSGSRIYATKNGRTVGVATSDARCVWVSAGDPLPAWNDRGWRLYGMGRGNAAFNQNNFISEFNNWWNETDFFFAIGGDVSLGLQAGMGYEINDMKFKIDANLASLVLLKGNAIQIGHDNAPWSFDGSFVGQNGIYGITQGVSIPLLGYKHSFNTEGYGHIQGSEIHQLNLGPISGNNNKEASIRIGGGIAFILGINIYVEFGVKPK